MTTRIFVFVAICVSVFGLQTQACKQANNDDNQINIMSPDVGADLVFFFKKDTNSNEIMEFERTVTGIPHGKSGFADLPGIMTGVAIRINGFDGEAIQFKPNATDEEKALVKKRVSESPLIYKVYENVIPVRITDLR